MNQLTPRVYLNSSRKNAVINADLGALLTKLGFSVFAPCMMTDQKAALDQIFARNLHEIKQSDLMVVVLAEYGKDTAAEVGIAYGLGIQTIALNYKGDPEDVMMYFALDQIVPQGDFEAALVTFKEKWQARHLKGR